MLSHLTGPLCSLFICLHTQEFSEAPVHYLNTSKYSSIYPNTHLSIRHLISQFSHVCHQSITVLICPPTHAPLYKFTDTPKYSFIYLLTPHHLSRDVRLTPMISTWMWGHRWESSSSLWENGMSSDLSQSCPRFLG